VNEHPAYECNEEPELENNELVLAEHEDEKTFPGLSHVPPNFKGKDNFGFWEYAGTSLANLLCKYSFQ
jgi:hypothetical protein